MFLRKLLRLLYSRVFIIALLLIVQLAFVLTTIIVLNDSYWAVALCTTVLSIALVLVLINNQEQNPSTKLAWILVIVLLPIVGATLYLMFGSHYASYKLRKQVLNVVAESEGVLPENQEVMEALEYFDPAVASQSKYLQKTTGMPPFAINRNDTKYYTSGEDIWPDMLAELRNAQKYIFIESFIVQEGLFWNSILEILTAKATAGVDVRVMFDDLGCINTLPSNYQQKLRSLGIKCTVFNPIKAHLDVGLNNRDHRKIIVIDGQVGIIGGINLADEYVNKKMRFGYWKDSALIIRGESVYSLCVMFLQNWNLYNPKEQLDYRSYYQPGGPEPKEALACIQPFHDNPFDGEHVGESAFINMINAANHYIYIDTPYFIVDNEMLQTLTLAAKRGVDVRICAPHIPDKWYVHIMTQAYYHPMLKAGIKVMEFKPGFNHTKSLVADDKYAFVGTINCDYRSFYHHFECGALLYNTASIADLKADFLATEKRCISGEQATINTPLPMRFLRTLLRLFAPLF